MIARLGAIVLLCGAFTSFAVGGQAKDAKEVLGTWEGESKCTIPDSSCHDEHVIYEIAANKEAAGRLKVDGYKVVKGEKQFMGTLGCEYEASTKVLSCTFESKTRNEWTYRVSGDSMIGTLVLGEEKKLYRKASVRRSAGH